MNEALRSQQGDTLIPQPYDFWHSGRLWYCKVNCGGKTYKGAGVSQDTAWRDALVQARYAVESTG